MSFRIDGYLIDVATSEKLTYETEVTEHPVERDAAIADHLIAKRPVLVIEGVVSDTPIGEAANDPSRNLEPTPRPSLDAFERLTKIHDDRRLVTVDCSFGRFDSMAMESFEPERDPQTAKALKFTATFRQVRIVDVQRTTVAVAIPNRGHVDAKTDKVKGTYVISFRAADRARVTKPGELPILTTTGVQRAANNHYTLARDPFGGALMDHYDADSVIALRNEVVNGFSPDGVVVGKQYIFIGETISKTPAVTYDAAKKAYTDGTGRDLTSGLHPPTKGASDDYWQQIAGNSKDPEVLSIH